VNNQLSTVDVLSNGKYKTW